LRSVAGDANAARVLYSGALYAAEEARALGLIDHVVAPAELQGSAAGIAADLGAKPAPAFAAIKRLLREPVVAGFEHLEPSSIERFVDIWYSDATRARLAGIQIHE
jgi:enoyl-CoA hydratase/carnithine racemase